MSIVGFGGWDHDTSAALLVDGRVAAVGEESRFTRLKHQGRLFRESARFVASRGTPAASMRGVYSFVEHFDAFCRGLQEHRHTAPSELRALDHHLCHAESSFGQSGYSDAMVLLLDGYGDGVSTSAWRMSRDQVERLFTVPFPHSIGALWMAASYLLGCGIRGAGKVMGMAAYGEPRYADLLLERIRLHGDGAYSFVGADKNPEPFIDSRHHILLPATGRPRAPSEPLEQSHMDVAASVQRVTEIIVSHILKSVRPTGSRNLCMGGGVALNSVLNGLLQRQGLCDHLYVPPNPGDDGTSVGAALHHYREIHGRATHHGLESPYLGEECDEPSVVASLKELGVDYIMTEDPAAWTAERLARGLVVGWFQGRAEIGPRALGNRSILADPSRADMRDRINSRVKAREWFRPFGPSVRASKVHEWFDGAGDSPYMSVVMKPRPSKAAAVPAVVHVDGSARVHTVTPQQNPLFARLLAEFERLTGIPMVLNTSYNVAGYPIVNTVENAMATLATTEMDAAVIGRCCVLRSGISRGVGSRLQR